MKTKTLPLLCFAGMLAALAPLTRADEMVTIPKSRLLELEQREREFNALKAELSKARGEREQLQREMESVETRRVQAEQEKQKLMEANAAAEARAVAAGAEPLVVRNTPPLAGLPPLEKGEVVDALDLMNHYRADAAGAAQRYGKQRLRVRGVVAGFDKPAFLSHYFILLQCADRQWRIACRIEIPDEFRAAYPIQHGQALACETRNGARLVVARVGQTIELEADCRGLKDQALDLTGCVVKTVE